MIDYYGTDADYIHLKWGDMRKAFNFTEEFKNKHPNFYKEYRKYWNDDPTCKFHTPLQIAQYVDMFNIPVRFYFNFTDTPVHNMTEMYEYFIREYTGDTKLDDEGKYRENYNDGMDGEKQVRNYYKVIKEDPNSVAITWHIDDVKSLDNTLTDEQAREVLHNFANNHDSSQQSMWDDIKFHIDLLKEGGEK